MLNTQPILLYVLKSCSSPVRQLKLRSVVSSTALGLEMFVKSVVCGCSLTYVPLGSVALRSVTMSPSCSTRFCIICGSTKALHRLSLCTGLHSWRRRGHQGAAAVLTRSQGRTTAVPVDFETRWGSQREHRNEPGWLTHPVR